jgi:phosphatidate cytidylyltransferase
VVDVKPVSSSDSKRLSGSNLALRVLSALVLGPLALLTAWAGDWPFALFWIVAALAVLWEWSALVVGSA